MLDRRLVEDTAFKINAPAGLVEKDWHVVRAIGVLASLGAPGTQLAFCGGTSLSIGWGILKRFSEDIDFKVTMPVVASTSGARAQRRTYRETMVATLASAEFQLLREPQVRNASTFFKAEFSYPSQFERGPGLRSHIQLELTFEAPALPAIIRPIQSLISRARNHAPEVAAFPCVDPVETAAEKLSALAWRVCVRERGAERDDPRIIRHLHDLAALEPHVRTTQFAVVLREALTADSGRGRGKAPSEPRERLALMLDRLRTDREWAREYDDYVVSVSFAPVSERISFSAALAAVTRLAEDDAARTV